MTKEELDKLKEYNKSTKDDNGIVMPSIETFDKKVKMAITLWPQKNKNGGIDYLLGKGVGVELALLGSVKGREKNGYDFPYRTHSDFEIYDTEGYTIPESEPFTYVFGAMEIYPKTRTKGLHDMPEDYMDKTYDVVEYKENEYLVPELEILFLDKYMRRESTPREEGIDAVLLLKQYKLDLDKIIYYFNEYVKKYELRKFIESINKDYEMIEKKLIEYYDFNKELFEEDGIDPTIQMVSTNVNRKIQEFSVNNKRLVVHGIDTSLCPDNIEYENKDGKIILSENTKEQIKNNLPIQIANYENYLDSILQSIVDTYNDIYSDDMSLK